MSDSQEKRSGPQTGAELYAMLKPLQEKRGYFFNKDETLTQPLLEELLVTKARYGYMACPCRLANGTFAADRDIVCPCTYREEDIKEFGVCYCGLYVREDLKDAPISKPIPERRPPEKIIFGDVLDS